ncbi:MAG: N-acetylmuramidase domain-containing protein [Pseudomonadota bacterium]
MNARELLKSLRSGGEISRRRIYNDVPWEDTSELMPRVQHERAADALSVRMRAVRAIPIVESRDRPLIDGVPIVRFEKRKWRDFRQATKTAMRFDGLKNARDLLTRWERFLEMLALQSGPAIKAHSFGAYQIMGFNAYRCGFENPGAFLDAMKTAEGQTTAFIRFVQSSPALHEALKRENARQVAYHYNGPAYERNNYHIKWTAALEASDAALV